MRILLLVMAVLVVPSLQAQETRPSVITTTGNGQVALSPDAARVHLEIETRGSSASAASGENGQRQRRMIDAMRRLGFKEDQVQLQSFVVRASTDYETQKLLFYEAAASVVIAVRPLDRLGMVIDTALAAGATGVRNIDFDSDSAKVARERLLTEAVAAARRDAAVLAAAAGGQLGALLDVSTSPCTVDRWGNVDVSEIAVTAASGYQSSIAALTPGEVSLRVSVCTRWELKR